MPLPFMRTGNNPLNYIDPSGHAQVCAQGDFGGGCGSSGTTHYMLDPEVMVAQLKTEFKNYLWDHIPTSVAITEGYTNQDGFIYERGESHEEIGVINFYSGEIASLESNGNFSYWGTPTISGTSAYIGLEFIYGATSVDSMLANGNYEGYNIGGDRFAKLTDTESKGQSLNPDGTPFIDPISNRSVKYEETSVGAGINVFPNVLEFGGFSGTSYTESVWRYKIPWWPNKVEGK